MTDNTQTTTTDGATDNTATTTTTQQQGSAFAAAAAGDNTAGTTTTTTATVVPLSERIPEKYRVAKEDGSIDVEASTAKLLDGHTELQKRFGAGDAPPKTPEEYTPTVEGLDFEALKADPLYTGFLKGAHAKGLTNDQVSYVLEQYASRAAGEGEATTLGMSEADFRAAVEPAFAAFGGYDKGMQLGLRALRTYGGDLTAEELASIPNNPLVAKVLAAVGKELPEDTGTPRAQQLDTSDWEQQVATLKASEAYIKPTHPEHAATMAKVTKLYQQRYPNK